ncbi:hypothetical protein A3B21_01970 [Candidatus Uhrbacteria bacterium RIFCSPLOWO2_01_FULL_47_24]|uniref:Uncharacterized protein n=1 Tax=Candidatus Uhrbacteria bacterium RIFCSPLOWO2_01_FULL_47_24 TaxID=1802401 RepID=A0A1F7UPC5_9BACT|nr:MAG: hypothetical protein A2753_01720 [Candidatus Uhrbacteria bacterium RIFCSPHIGHO2_01_FULL_47_11]OGL67936.1 MAG: hypothetical protein A3D58_05165 [Candidatus Uhrbacteria bacterium RIFCSPHIGHO2_02_FULL_46_47]OGL75207.1 MAG: hypothetical protein A3F52_04155 [Candidatus Uhrbacteria bacterium RIFCSPHIGHO2_12_FULL_47_11]OGL80122.1 MAG: hypothetical protein A3B21_01970 [Candidatus Uhrbacteria bacterium RIFCSPLOWO2_01_FULL_47_24]OGL84907.1 MAG: hypothetical protein A3J03_04350 [Candidatus Uhrbact
MESESAERYSRRWWQNEIARRIKDADEFVQEWERAMVQLAAKRTSVGPDPQWEAAHRDHLAKYEWLDREVRDFLSWYRSTVVPVREEAHLGSVGAHKTDVSSLFGSAARIQTHFGKGILREGFTRGDFGFFESEEAGGQGGWWAGESIGGQHQSNECWVIKSPGAVEEERLGKQVHAFTLVFFDPRTYRWYLSALQKMVEGGEIPVPHNALRLGQLKQWLEEHQGKWPDEIKEIDSGT